MNRQKIKEILYPALALVIICLVVSTLLSVTYYITKKNADDTIDVNAVSRVLNLNADNSENLNIEKLSDNAYKVNGSSDEILGYVFLTSSKGYGGNINILCGLNSDGVVLGVTVLNSSETPGLGKKVEEDTFLNQYKMEKFIESFKVVKGETNKENEIQAITGATVSSEAVTDAVNDAIDMYVKLIGGES